MGKYEKVQKFFYSNRKKVGKVDKDGNEDIITISYKIKFIQVYLVIKIIQTRLMKN